MRADRQRRARLIATWGPQNIGAIYVMVIICVVFSFWAPGTFPTAATIKQVLNENAVVAIGTLALVVPLATGTFDLSFAYTMSLASVTSAYFVVEHDTSVWVAFVVALLVSLVVGLMNAVVVVGMKIDSFIATLATGSLIQAFIIYFTHGGIDIIDPSLSGDFAKLGQSSIDGIILPVAYALVLAIVLWIAMAHTATGRRLYATGFNPEAARLTHIRVDRLRFASLIVSALIAGFAGIVLASRLGSGSTTAGNSYLLPCFAAAFVGATQFKGGQFNAWGSVAAVVMLGTGVVGLGLVGAPPFGSSLFTGLVLLASLAASGANRRRLRSGPGRRAWWTALRLGVPARRREAS